MTKYIASFQPEAWQNDCAIPVDPEGETEWDCTTFVTDPPGWCKNYFGQKFHKAAGDGDEFLDTGDVLLQDPAAPEWVRNWRGPFTISVRAALP